MQDQQHAQSSHGTRFSNGQHATGGQSDKGVAAHVNLAIDKMAEIQKDVRGIKANAAKQP